MNRGIITISETGAVTMPTAPIWMTLFEIADLFGVFSCDVRKAILTIYKNKELNKYDTMKYIKQLDGISYDTYNIEMIIAIASVSRSFFFLSKGHCSAIIGQTTNCTPSRKIKLYSVDRQSGSRHSASFRYRIHGRVFYRPTGCRQYAPRCGSPEVSGNSLSSLPTLPCW